MLAPERTIETQAVARITVQGTNRSSQFAAYWLQLLTGRRPAAQGDADVLITDATDGGNHQGATIRLWDYQVGYDGSGVLASAVSGAATVIGEADGPPVPLPCEMPEKWCGLSGAILALAECWPPPQAHPPATRYDISSADILRSFCLQNSGGPVEMKHSWRRNGRLCIDHGGIFPMGFFRCRDGHVAVLGRSRRDWKNIQAAIGNPEWAQAPAFEDPFQLARSGTRADALLEQSLARYNRDELLERGIASEAVLAPVYSQDEAAARGVFRAGFVDQGTPKSPFIARPLRCGEAHEPKRTKEAASGLPLAGLRVIELAWIWSGPMVGQLLADLGAEVIKVESPSRFDLYRTRGLEAMRGKMDEATRIESSLYFHSLNRNKTGLSLDLKSEHGRQAFKELAAVSHLLIDNFTVGTLDRLGLGGDVLSKVNSSLVMLSMSGPGQGSRVERLRSYGLVLSALAGAESHVTSDGKFVGSPTFSISDPNAALFAALAALAAVLHARESGEGMTIDLSQIEAAATLAGSPSVHNEYAVVRTGEEGGYMLFDGEGRSAPVLNLEDTDDAPQFADCPGWLQSQHPITGAEQLVAAPWRVNGERPSLRSAAPLLGSGNATVLRDILGWPTARIQDFASG